MKLQQNQLQFNHGNQKLNLKNQIYCLDPPIRSSMTVISSNLPLTGTNQIKRLPKQLFRSRSTILKLLPLEKDPSLYGVDGFSFFLLTYLQIEHWNCKFVALLEKRKLNEKNENPPQQKQEDSLSVASSSVNIRERKVSFGIMPMQRQNSESGKKKPKANMWTIVPKSQKNISISLQRHEQHQKQLRILKEVLYKYGREKDVLNEDKSRHEHEISIKIAKALQILFPEDQNYLNSKLFANLLNSEITIPTMVSGLCRESKDFELQKKLSFLREIFLEISMEAKPILDQGLGPQSRRNCRKMISNFTHLMRRFGFDIQKDVRILHEGEPQNELKLDQSQGQKCWLSSENSIESRSEIGVQIKNGLFAMVILQDGYIFSLDVDSGEELNENVQTLFMNSFLSHSYVEREKLSLEGLQNVNTKATTCQQFTQRYNNRYFKNQRLIYKQKSKEERFREQQLLEPVTMDNYGEYQILINSKHSNGQVHPTDNNPSHQHHPPIQTHEQTTVQIRRDSDGNTHFTGNISLEYTRQSETCTIHELIIKENQRYTFFVEETEFTQQASERLVYENEEREVHGQKGVRVQPRQKLEEFYSRNDFQISDNEILDDIERVLI